MQNSKVNYDQSNSVKLSQNELSMPMNKYFYKSKNIKVED